jgi:phage terminase Nu1 subunit (DNA packaging protein)
MGNQNSGRRSSVEESATADAHVLYMRSRAKKEAHKAKLAEIEERRQKRELVEASVVRREADAAARMVRDAFLALPGRVSATLVGMNEEHIRNTLRHEIRTTLETISQAILNEDQDITH